MTRECVFSPDRLHRYTLWRSLGVPLFDARPGFCNFIMLNPSTADETKNDPTIRRCIGFAKAWGFGELCVTNLFAFRATDPRDMRVQYTNAVGVDNDRWIAEVAREAELIVTAWGNDGEFLGRHETVLKAMVSTWPAKTHFLKQTDRGCPSHPLYLPADLLPKRWT